MSTLGKLRSLIVLLRPDLNPLDARAGLVLIARTPEGNAMQDEEVLYCRWSTMKSVLKKVDVIHLGVAYSGVFGQIGRGNGDGILINPTPVPLGVLKVNQKR